jgi:uncharacterized caspase-like protein
MLGIRKLVAVFVALLALAFNIAPSAAQAEKRIALVIGNAGYQAGALNTPANDAGLIAQTLQAAGFDVVGARDLDQDTLRHAFRDFVEKATASGPDTVAFIYLSGYGLQLEGENYFVPIDARIARDSEVAVEALRISDYTRPLAAMKLKASIVVLDAARASPFANSGPPLAGGLALVEPEPGVLIAFNSAPGTVAPEGQGPYGPYAQALAEMIREGGLPLTDVFERTRLRVNDITKGAEVPWHASNISAPLVFFERAADAPPPAISTEQTAAIRARPMRDLDAREAYIVALERDTLEGYSDFLAAYPSDPMARRIRAIIAARREAITWRRTRLVDTPRAYWSYLRRYPDGPHAGDAHRRLAFLAAAFEPPPSFAVMAYDLPPPPPEEIIYIERPVLVFDDPVFNFAPPPPAPVIFLAPPPPEFVVLEPPPPPVGIFVLPTPVYRPVPVWVRPPEYVAPPPDNVIYNNVHNTVVVNNVTNTVTVTNQSGQTTTIQPAAQAAAPPQAAAPAQAGPAGAPVAPAPVAAIGPALPPSVAQKAVTLQYQTPPGAGTSPTGPAQSTNQGPAQPGRPLPGSKGQQRPLPAAKGVVVPPPAAPSAAIMPGTASPPGTAKPGMPSPQVPATKPVAPSAAVTPAAQAPPAAPSGGHALPTPPAGVGAKPGTPLQAPAATLSPGGLSTATKPVSPSAPARSGPQPPAQMPTAKLPPSSTHPKPVAPAPPPPPSPSSIAKPASPPPQVPAARLAPPQAPPPSAKPATPPPSPPPAAMLKPAAPPPQPPPAAKVVIPPTPPPPSPSSIAKPASPPPQVPAARLAPPQAPPPSAKPATPPPSPPPAAMVKPAAPPQPPPAAKIVAPPPPQPPALPPAAKPAAPAPAAAASKPAVPAPQLKGCPPGKTAAVVNGQPVCK